jgi:uncharacterized protein YbcV (DUF1398 family)
LWILILFDNLIHQKKILSSKSSLSTWIIDFILYVLYWWRSRLKSTRELERLLANEITMLKSTLATRKNLFLMQNWHNRHQIHAYFFEIYCDRHARAFCKIFHVEISEKKNFYLELSLNAKVFSG